MQAAGETDEEVATSAYARACAAAAAGSPTRCATGVRASGDGAHGLERLGAVDAGDNGWAADDGAGPLSPHSPGLDQASAPAQLQVWCACNKRGMATHWVPVVAYHMPMQRCGG